MRRLRAEECIGLIHHKKRRHSLAAQFIATHSLLPGSDYTIAPFEIHYSDRCLALNCQ
jgi:hypothetical protein